MIEDIIFYGEISNNSRYKSVDEEITLAGDVEIFYDLEGIDHNGTGGSIEHCFFFSKYIILLPNSVGSEK